MMVKDYKFIIKMVKFNYMVDLWKVKQINFPISLYPYKNIYLLWQVLNQPYLIVK